MEEADRLRIADLRAKIQEQINIRDEAYAMIGAYRKMKEGIQRRCKHPNGYSYTAMGDPGFKCPDCDYDR